jgi:superfamily II DNA or RNA helicase
MLTLRPYQLEAIEGARNQLRAGKKRVLVICPTGGGKTVVAAEIIRSADAKGSRTLFLAHRRELIAQTVDKLHRFGVTPGVIQAGFPMALHRSAQVASVQTLIRRPEVLSRVDLIFIDEAHHALGGNTYGKLLDRYPGALVVGLTATPWRLDGRGLADVFDGHVIVSTPRQLRDEGFLVPVGGWQYEAIDVESARVKLGDYSMADLQASATSKRIVGNIVSEWLLHAAGKRTVLFATSVNHSLLMVGSFRNEGVPAEHIDGEMPAEERDAVLHRLRTGQTLVVCNCNVLTEGFDCPELEVCILARPTLSTSLYLQMVGRVLRPAAGKTMARLHDHAGCLETHGHPYAERDYSPELSSRGDKPKKSEGKMPEKKCAACKSVISRWPCDACGYCPSPQDLQLEYVEAAAKREIQNDGVAPSKRTESDAERRDKWRKRHRFDVDFDDRYRFFRKMVERHGPAKGARVYWWVSGFSERPRPEWVAEAAEGTAA